MMINHGALVLAADRLRTLQAFLCAWASVAELQKVSAAQVKCLAGFKKRQLINDSFSILTHQRDLRLLQRHVRSEVAHLELREKDLLVCSCSCVLLRSGSVAFLMCLSARALP
jgi:hypothetical protein